MKTLQTYTHVNLLKAEYHLILKRFVKNKQEKERHF